jgi:diguanylate cyclase (GGDEF)-like protein
MIVGEIREVQKRKFEELQSDLEGLREAFDQLSRSYETVNKAKQELDTRIISQEHTLSTLYDAAQALKSLQEKEIYPAVLQLVRNFISAEACSIYMLSENRLKLISSSGDPTKGQRKIDADVDDGMMGRAFSSGETVSLNFFVSAKDFDEHDGSGIIISAPLVNSNKQTLGVLNIEKLPFVKFNPQTVRMASLLADWCGAAIENARTYKETKDRNISDDITGAYTYGYLRERLKEEFSRARRYKHPLSVLSLDIADFPSFSAEVKRDVLTVLSLVLQNKLRSVDLLFHGSDPGRYIIVLPDTPLEGAQVAKERVLKEINAFKFRPYEDEKRLLHIEIAEKGLSEDRKGPEDLIPEASGAAKGPKTQATGEKG